MCQPAKAQKTFDLNGDVITLSSSDDEDAVVVLQDSSTPRGTAVATEAQRPVRQDSKTSRGIGATMKKPSIGATMKEPRPVQQKQVCPAAACSYCLSRYGLHSYGLYEGPQVFIGHSRYGAYVMQVWLAATCHETLIVTLGDVLESSNPKEPRQSSLIRLC